MDRRRDQWVLMSLGTPADGQEHGPSAGNIIETKAELSRNDRERFNMWALVRDRKGRKARLNTTDRAVCSTKRAESSVDVRSRQRTKRRRNQRNRHL
jgi:hypothetical protein